MTRKLAVSSYYWIDDWQRDQAEVFQLTSDVGFDGIEISLYAQPDIDPEKMRVQAKANGLELLVSTGVPTHADPSSVDPTIRQEAVRYLTECLETTASMGATQLGGLTYSPWMSFPEGANSAEARDRAVETLRRVAPVAERLGVTLCLEPVNRFETYVCNTAAQGCEMLDQIGSTAIALQLDSFHLNIEESNLADAIRASGSHLGHFQVADNDRSVPGAGTIDFVSIGQALDDIDYRGWVALETFPHPGTGVGRDTFTWRPLVEDHRADAEAALSLLRTCMGGTPE